MARRRSNTTDQRGHMRIRSRLALVLLVPLVALLGVTVLQVSSAFADSREASRLTEGAEVGLSAFRLIDALQAERSRLAADETPTAEERSAVERLSGELRTRAASADPRLSAAVDRALVRTEAAGLLAATNTGGIVAIDGYTPAIDELLRVGRIGFDPGSAIDDQPATTTNFLASAEEAAALERDLLVAMTVDQALVPIRFQQVNSLAAQQQILVEEAARTATPALQPRIDRLNDSLAAAADERQDIFSDDLDPAVVDEWIAGADARIDQLKELRDQAAAVAVDAVNGLASSSRQVLLLSALAFLATLIITGLLVRSATRSIAKPLQDLAAQAEEVATHRLPEAVAAQQSEEGDLTLPALRATGAAEVRDVAGAFNDVQTTALRLAGEQAVLRRNLAEALTNLGRRNQALLGRQLDFISSLEKRETDPAFLDHLFRLDHLASRMRRNAESLLILAGSETPRRRRKPAEIPEVVRAAMSEVEDFERVRLGQLGKATLVGPVVIDLVHLLAELIENALGFSPPETTVEIDGRSLGQGGYQLAVIDHGVGMSDVEFVSANQRLAGLDEVDGMPTRYLGQYVIAKLAAKIGALVRLQPSVGGKGVTAVVSLPATAMVGAADRSGVAQPLPGSRAAREQGPLPFAPGAGLAAAPQPDPVIDPAADPFAEPAPDLSVPEPTVPSFSDPVPGFDDVPSPLDHAPSFSDPVPGFDDLPSPAEPVPSDEAPTFSDPVPGFDDVPSPPDHVPTFSDPVPGFEDTSFPDPVSSFDLPDLEAAVHEDGLFVDPAAAPIPEWSGLGPDGGVSDETVAEEILAAETIEGLATDEVEESDGGVEVDAPTGVEEAPSAEIDAVWALFERASADPSADGSSTEESASEDVPAVGGADPFHDTGSTIDRLWEPVTPFEPADDAAPPPPPPAEVPVQQEWDLPAPPAPTFPSPSVAPPGPPPVVEPAHAAAPVSAAEELLAPLAPSDDPLGGGLTGPVPTPAGVPDEAEPSAGRLGGGLARRVPGASLAESPLGSPLPTAAPAPDRSADGVRSMLSSFQSGRSRGRVGAEADDGAVSTIDDLPSTDGGSHGMSGTTEVDGSTGAQEANEWEDPR